VNLALVASLSSRAASRSTHDSEIFFTNLPLAGHLTWTQVNLDLVKPFQGVAGAMRRGWGPLRRGTNVEARDRMLSGTSSFG